MKDQQIEEKIRQLLSEMTVEEKVSFCSGDDTWHAPSLARLGIPQVMKCDGPHGLRKRTRDENGNYYTVKATCFPPAAAMANSWDRSLTERVGGYIAKECRAEQVSILLGPGMNIKRSPLCGRNFEYYSEDPYLSGEMAAAFIRGVQGEGVAACAKHFCVNNQETRRFSTSANVSERALQEIYLPSFEAAVKEGNVATVMHAYNRVNGKYVGEDKRLIDGILRKKWGFDGYVMSDWGAISDRVAAYKAGTDVEMPPVGEARSSLVLAAYARGEITMEEIDASVANVLRVIYSHLPAAEKSDFDVDAHHRAAEEAAEECMVLLKNDGDLLPLEAGKPLALIGGFAKKPRFQGGGSSHVEPTRVDDVSEYVLAENGAEIVYAPGYNERHETDDALIAEAVEAAKRCGRAVIFAGMPDSYESEGADRRHMHLPPAHDRLIEAVAAACADTVVVLFGGSPAELPWIDRVPALLHAYLGGQALGGAIARILFGKVNPSGKLAETHPIRLCDNPSYLNFPGNGDECFYGEDIYVGYRYYDKKQMDVLFPFGYGLSYTKFAYTSIKADQKTVTVTVKNVGDRVGKEVVELYVGALPNKITETYSGNSSFGFDRPVRELRGFKKIELAPGAEKKVTFKLNDRMFSVFDDNCGDFRKIAGVYELSVGGSSRDLPLSAVIEVTAKETPVAPIQPDTVVEDLLLDPRYPTEVIKRLFRRIYPAATYAKMEEANFSLHASVMRRKFGRTLRQAIEDCGGALSVAALQSAIDEANAALQE